MTNTRERKHELRVPVRGGGNVKLKSCSVYYLQTLKIYFNIFSSPLGKVLKYCAVQHPSAYPFGGSVMATRIVRMDLMNLKPVVCNLTDAAGLLKTLAVLSCLL